VLGAFTQIQAKKLNGEHKKGEVSYEKEMSGWNIGVGGWSSGCDGG